MSSKVNSIQDSQISEFYELKEVSKPILDNIEITEPLRYCPNAKSKYAFCGNCENIQVIHYGCKERNCAYCQTYRQRQLYNKYLQSVLGWKVSDTMKINFLTLTIKNVPEISKDWLQWRDNQLKLFIRRLKNIYRFESGFINKEMTWSEDKGYHYHFHLLFYGPSIDLKNPLYNLSDIWLDITKDSKIVKLLSNFTNASHSLNYLLKYVCKTAENNEAMQIYYDLTKKKRYFQTFGKTYGNKKREVSKKEKIPFRCSTCFGEFEKNWSNFGIPLFNSIPNYAKDRPVIPYNYHKVWVNYQSMKECNQFDKNSTQLTLERGASQSSPPDKPPLSIYDRLKNMNYKDFIGYNEDILRQQFSITEIKKLLWDGYLMESRPGEYERL